MSTLGDISAEMQDRVEQRPHPEGAAMWEMLETIVDKEEFINFVEERLMTYAQFNSTLFSGHMPPSSKDMRMFQMMSTIAAEFFYVGYRHAKDSQSST